MFESERIKVLVVDDSAIVRDIIASIIEKQDDMELVGTAPDPFIARDKIVRLNPDVITLDIEMPRMDGLTFLERLMQYYPMPVIIVSSITTNDKFAAIKALELGAYDIVNKPGGSLSVEEVTNEILLKIRNAYFNRNTFLKKWKELSPKLVKEKKAIKKPVLSQVITTDKVIAIGASTGGTVAIEYIFERLPQHLPPILVVQHMPVNFTNQFAQRLNEICQLTVKEAEDEELLQAGTAYIAPGGIHLVIERKGASLYAMYNDGERVNFQKPAADVLFKSMAKVAGKNALGILLTGMGKDGAAGLLEMKNAGAHTIAQDEATSIVWGMPRAAVEMGAAVEVLSLDDIVKAIIAFAQT
ncbi:MAG: chemotaxis response regulator protein-glutamate methylesterase [Spirochaetota bacterium]